MTKQKSKQEICWMVANEYYELLIHKKEGKATRLAAHKARDRFLSSMKILREHD